MNKWRYISTLVQLQITICLCRHGQHDNPRSRDKGLPDVNTTRRERILSSGALRDPAPMLGCQGREETDLRTPQERLRRLPSVHGTQLYTGGCVVLWDRVLGICSVWKYTIGMAVPSKVLL